MTIQINVPDGTHLPSLANALSHIFRQPIGEILVVSKPPKPREFKLNGNMAMEFNDTMYGDEGDIEAMF